MGGGNRSDDERVTDGISHSGLPHQRDPTRWDVHDGQDAHVGPPVERRCRSRQDRDALVRDDALELPSMEVAGRA